jgi:hypothetical protein
MPSLERTVPQQSQHQFIDQLFAPDLQEQMFFFLFNPVNIPANQDLYTHLSVPIHGIFLERRFQILLTYTFTGAQFVLDITSKDEKRAQEILNALRLYIDKAIDRL